MTTSEPGDLPELPVPSGLPDPKLLARMANEFFTALPGLTEEAEPLLGAAAAAPALPSEAELRALPASLGAGAPAMPGALMDRPSAAAPSFSFLEDARAFGSAPALPVAAYAPTVKIPTETELKAFDAKLPGALPAIPSASSAPSAPQVPGAPARGVPAVPDYGFLDEARRLYPIDAAPVLEPMGGPGPAAPLDAAPSFFDAASARRDFPILEERVNGRPLVWLDNAATTQKPQSVIDRLSYYYEHENSNVHRAAHELAARATDAYEAAREKTRRFLNASSVKEIVFVRGATEAINLAAQSWGERNIYKGDEILITHLEHHANIVPWQMLCQKKGARLKVAPVDDRGQVLLDEYERLLGPKTKLVSMAHVSNALGTVNPVKEMVAMAKRHGAATLVDGAQAVSHMRVDVQEYDCDFYVFSGHKLYAPTGIGVLFGKADVLAHMPPWHGGGNMIKDVTFEKTVYQEPPLRFEAGTGIIADAIGLGAAIDYLGRIGMENVARHEHELLRYATERMVEIPGLRMIGTAKDKAGVLSFVLEGFRTEDVGAALNKEGIAVRSGHHCAQPILRRFGVESTVRPSLALYNTCDDIDALIAAIWNLKNSRGPGPL